MATSRFEEYAGTSLSCAGFALLRADLAALCRPDLLQTSPAMAGDIASGAALRIKRWPRIRLFRVGLDGLGESQVVARSPARLTERIEAVLGVRVTSLVETEFDPATGAERLDAPSRSWRDRVRELQGDIRVGLVTQEGPRTCSECEHLTATHACKAPHLSGVARPKTREPRRCVAFVPEADGGDRRTGRELWPELEVADPDVGSDSNGTACAA